MKSLIMVTLVVTALAQSAQAAICNATVNLNRSFSGHWIGTELLNAGQVMRQAGLAREGNVLTNLYVYAVGQPGQSAILAFKYSLDNNLRPAPGRPDVPSGAAIQVQPYAYEQIFHINHDRNLDLLNVTYRQRTQLRPGETSARYYFVNGAGHAYATKAFITVRTPDSRCR